MKNHSQSEKLKQNIWMNFKFELIFPQGLIAAIICYLHFFSRHICTSVVWWNPLQIRSVIRLIIFRTVRTVIDSDERRSAQTSQSRGQCTWGQRSWSKETNSMFLWFHSSSLMCHLFSSSIHPSIHRQKSSRWRGHASPFETPCLI